MGLKHQLMTQYTSFIAVDKELSEPPQGQLVTETVPVMMPEGMTEQSVGRSRAVARPGQTVQQAASPVVADSAPQPQAYTNPPPAMPAASGPSRSSSTSNTPPAGGGTFRSGSGGGGGGGPIGPITAIFSLGGAGAAAMMRRRKALSTKDQSTKELMR